MHSDPPVIDSIDEQIVSALVRDGRVTIPRLAEAVGVSRAAAYRRVARLRETGVIRGFRADVDVRALGYGVAALVQLKARQSDWQGALQELSETPGVEWIGLGAGPADFVLLVRAHDLEELRDVVLHGLTSADGVENVETSVLLEERYIGAIR